MLSHFSLVWLFVTLWTIACQASLSMRFSRQEYWSGYHFLLQGIFPTQGLNLRLNWTLNLEPWLNLDWIELALAGRFFTTSATCKLQMYHVCVLCPTVCDPMDCNLSSSSVHGISQVRILEWLPFPSPGNLPNPGVESLSPALQGDSLLLSHQGSPQFGYIILI